MEESQFKKIKTHEAVGYIMDIFFVELMFYGPWIKLFFCLANVVFLSTFTYG